MNNQTLWNHDAPVSDLWLDVPAWIESDITGADIAAIIQGGCASGAYMPAVTYHKAREVMGEHGDDVLEFIERELGELPAIPSGESWSGTAVFFLSYAVELWASMVEDEVTAAIESADDDDDDDDTACD